MKSLLSLIAATCCVGALSAQTTVLTEDFNTNVVPPAGWTTQNLNANTMFSEPWNSDGLGRAWHGDGGSADGQAENLLVTPLFDLTGMTEAYVHMDIETNYVAYMAHSNPSYGNGVTTLEASHDGGVTWMVLWTDDIDVLDEDVVLTRDIDISAHAGHTGMMLAIHFSGDWAHEIWVDNFAIDDQSGGGGGGGLTYAITPMTAGSPVTFSITGAAPSSNCIIGYSLAGAGPINTAYGVVDMTPPISRFPTLTTDANGDCSLTLTVPANASGVTLYTQGLNNGALTNSLAETVQ
jgi:hypothetical protein